MLLRKNSHKEFNQIASSLPQIVSEDTDAWRIAERLQVISLIRFPLIEIDPNTVVTEQRERVQALCLKPNPADKRIISCAAHRFLLILNRSLDTLRPGDLRHGPGSVAETGDQIKKRDVIWVDPDILRAFESFLPKRPWRLRRGISKTCVVPKDHKTMRVIAAEPTWTQWCQQLVKGSLMRNIVSDPYFKGHISFTDQGLQRTILRKDRIASIDLSDASDTLRWKHLLLLTRGDLKVREVLRALRTLQTEYRGESLPTIGAFPMGAATCFPIETLCFACLLLAYCECETGKLPSTWGVFGDDILVDDFLAGGFCNFLVRCGFKPNMSKTFIGGNFVESCGVYLYKGVNVTPTKIKKGAPTSSLDIANITWSEYHDSVVHLPHLRRWMAGRVLDPFFHNTVERWNSDLQRLEVKHLRDKVSTSVGRESYYEEALLRGSCDVACGSHRAGHGWSSSLTREGGGSR
jgi:hypothetical protein